MRIIRTAFLICAGATISWAYRYHNQYPSAPEPMVVSVLHQAGERLQSILPLKIQSTALVHAAEGREQIFFSPSQNLEQVDVELIEQAHASIRVAMYAFTDRNIAAALERQAARGVKVFIYRDRKQFEEERMRRSGVAEMLATRPTIHVRVKGTNELMHDKIMLIDDAILRDGSGNWSVSAARYQDNQITVTQDASEIAAFNRDFEAMWDRKDNLVVR